MLEQRKRRGLACDTPGARHGVWRVSGGCLEGVCTPLHRLNVALVGLGCPGHGEAQRHLPTGASLQTAVRSLTWRSEEG